ncbi:asparagine synthase (glutamine-hydrolyzing) [Hyphobacterium sp.]|uniref:asparagine synthase (glutamine-hydrolyzing) n=1 Tax=Hyphobacterium sp. TaxID=2004662 RepID=UPI003BAAE437
MCGIAGFLNLDGRPASTKLLKKMTDAIVHRGPDGEGQWTHDCLALGHRRLSIIDLSTAGLQPMQTPDGRLTIVFNGEIYNYLDLRAELQAEGVRFQSRTDTEVILHAVDHWGLEAALKRFNGMFGIALYDRKTGHLTLARDRFGVKPMYYWQNDSVLLFGSEIKAMLAHPALDARLDPSAFREYLTFQNYFTDRTLFAGVKTLPHGCYAQIGVDDPGKPDFKITRYWDFDFQEPEGDTGSEEDYQRELRHLFEQAVTRQLVSDVDVGAYLSGGMDSGSITAVAAQQLDSMRTFTCGFDLSSASGMELQFDERRDAEHMSYLFQTEQYEMVLKSGDMERIMPALAYTLEEPRVGQSYPNMYVAQLAGKFNKVVLAGTGGDELFAGYPWRYYSAVSNTDFDQYIDKYLQFWRRLLPADAAPDVFAPIWEEAGDFDPRAVFKDVFKGRDVSGSRPEDYVNHSLYFEAKTFLQGLLAIEDKIAMAHSLETRVPFLDNDLVDFAMKIPARLKLGRLDEVAALGPHASAEDIAKFKTKTTDGKLILRKVMKGLLPDEISHRIKQGFSAPDASWFKGESIDYVRETLMTPKAHLYDLLDYSTVKGLLNEHLEGKANRRLLVWSLLNLEEMFNAYKFK